MTDTTKVLQQAHAELWAFRDEMGDYWPTPDTLDALRFAVTEAGEALDAWMRANRPQYARNRERLDYGEAVLDELADCAMMLLTAAGCNHAVDTWWNDKPFSWDVDTITKNVVDQLFGFPGDKSKEFTDFADDCVWVTWGIATYPGMDLLPRLQSRYARIRAKNKPNPVQAAYAANHAAYEAQLIHYGAQNATAQDVLDRREAQTYGTDTL